MLCPKAMERRATSSRTFCDCSEKSIAIRTFISLFLCAIGLQLPVSAGPKIVNKDLARPSGRS